MAYGNDETTGRLLLRIEQQDEELNRLRELLRGFTNAPKVTAVEDDRIAVTVTRSFWKHAATTMLAEQHDDDIVADLEALADIADGATGKAHLVLVNGDILREAATAIRDLRNAR